MFRLASVYFVYVMIRGNWYNLTSQNDIDKVCFTCLVSESLYCDIVVEQYATLYKILVR